MRIVINHLTRMRDGICVAAVDLATYQHVRPVFRFDHLPYRLLVRHGGPFDMGNVVDLGPVRPQPSAPHVEDHVFDESHVRLERTMEPQEFWQVLDDMTQVRLEGIFAVKLKDLGRGRYVADEGTGEASLGCLYPATAPSLRTVQEDRGRPHVRMTFSDGAIEADAPVSDLRLYGNDHLSPDPRKVAAVAAHIPKSGGVILGVGLTRGYPSSRDGEPVHWLQVNNIHVKDRPLWQLK